MDPTTAATQNRELVLLRLEQYFPDFLQSLLPTALWQAVPYYVLAAFAAVLTAAWLGRTVVRYTSADHSWRGRPGPAGKALWSACVASWVLFGAWFLVVFFLNDTFSKSSGSGTGEVAAADRTTNAVLWIGFLAAV